MSTWPNMPMDQPTLVEPGVDPMSDEAHRHQTKSHPVFETIKSG